MNKPIYILAIESSCDETAAAVLCNDNLLSNVIATQAIHQYYGGVIPELASRAHQQKIIPVVEEALRQAKVSKNDLDAVAFTRGPGLIGALLVGVSFAKSFALALNIPIIEVNHLQAHVLAHFIKAPPPPEGGIRPHTNLSQGHERKEAPPLEGLGRHPKFPFLCLTVSGGHTQIVKIDDYDQMKIIGETIDDAAGEAFDKAAKVLGLPYPGGPLIDKLAKEGNPKAFQFPIPNIPNLDFSFSGLKTSFLYFVRDHLAKDPEFIEKHKADICASIQYTIVDILMRKLRKASEEKGIREIAIAGGVSANSGLRNAVIKMGHELQWNVFIPRFEYCTDNAAMIGITAYYKFLKDDFAEQDIAPLARMPF